MNPNPQMAETALTKQTEQPLVFDECLESPMAAAILGVMSDEFSRAILNCLVESGKSIEDIASQNGIPVSTTYRRVHEMCHSGLVIVERVAVTKSGKSQAIYRSTFRGAKIDVELGGVRVVGLPNDRIPDITFRLWQFSERQSAIQ